MSSMQTLKSILLGGCFLLGAATTLAGSHEGAKWGYSGATGPENWGKLSADYKACDGKMQTPIDLAHSNAEGNITVNMDYKPVIVDMFDKGGHPVFNVEEGSALHIDQKTYYLKHLHFHTPSEHKINGEAFAMEVHFVHVAKDGALAVIGILFKEGAENKAFQSLFNHLPFYKGHVDVPEKSDLNPMDLFPNAPTFYRYMGSLTTPPCTEGVNWFVLHEVQSVSAMQAKAMAQAQEYNARPIQAINNRLVVRP